LKEHQDKDPKIMQVFYNYQEEQVKAEEEYMEEVRDYVEKDKWNIKRPAVRFEKRNTVKSLHKKK